VDFVLVGEVKSVVPSEGTPEAQAAWLRNHRRAIALAEEMTDFVILGVTTGARDDLRYALLPELYNPKRVLLEPVLLSSDNRRCESVDFVLVGEVKSVVPSEGTPEAQAAWLRNHRRAQREKLQAAKIQGREQAELAAKQLQSWRPCKKPLTNAPIARSKDVRPPVASSKPLGKLKPLGRSRGRREAPAPKVKSREQYEERRSADSIMDAF